MDTLPAKDDFYNQRLAQADAAQAKSGDRLSLRTTRKGKVVAWGAGVLLAAGALTGVALAESGHKEKPAPVPTLGAVNREAGNLKNNTPTLSEDQVSRWPSRETVVATTAQSRDGLSAIAAAINPEVYSGTESNDTTRKALEADLTSETAYGQGNVRPGEAFSVANIHPDQANAVTGGNNNIPNR